MTSRLFALSIAATDPQRLALFWAMLLGRQPSGDGMLLPPDDTGFPIRFVATDLPKTAQNRVHFDLTSTSLDDQQETVSRALDLGGNHADVGQTPEDEHVVLADPEGNEFCVIEPGNRFLAGCGLVGALSGDGPRAAGLFWSAALGWPLVWDENEETAIQSPHGGPKITWGGPPLMPVPEFDRLRLDLIPAAGSTQQDELERLLTLGATRRHPAYAEPGTVALADPGGTEFHLLAEERGA